jgi:hypothetical protein
VGEPVPPPSGWNKTLDDLIGEARRGERGPIGEPETRWAIEYERSLLQPDVRYPRMGDVYEAVEDTPVEYLTAWSGPYTGSGQGVLLRGDRIRIEHEPAGAEPIGVYAVPLDYTTLEERMVPAASRLAKKYDGFYFFVHTADLNRAFRLVT